MTDAATLPSWRVGIDTGGTFTDVVAARDGEVRRGKVASTPPTFDDGVLAALAAVGLEPTDILLLAHGTTVTTNAVITKTGARTGLLTTRGFRDVLELRRHDSDELYDILWDPPPPLVPRRHRYEIRERVDYRGRTLTPLDEDDVRRAVPLAGELTEVDLAVPGHVGGAGVADVGVVRPHHRPGPVAVVREEPVEGLVHVPVPDVPRPRVAPDHRPVVRLGVLHHQGVLLGHEGPVPAVPVVPLAGLPHPLQ